jgi:asparagine synthase (glutamine-hydrolysing)
MCGIAGKICFNSSEVKESDLAKMAAAIAYRGPDDEGIYISPDKRVGLANRRLAIIDLSSKGHMPMNYMGRYWITYNGEIYNFNDERKRLQNLGYRFKSTSDTEVILALYDKYKERLLAHLRGMFAFAIYDQKENTLFLARDRIGKKPLKYFWDRDTFIFASELKAILTQKEVRRVPDLVAIHNYLTYGYVPAPRTGFEGIKKLQPGHFIMIDLKSGKLSDTCYWEPDFSEKLQLSEDEWCQKIADELECATQLRMISDVPIGAFLSGGVDSSSVVAMMARLSSRPIKTFTIGFKETKNDERPYADRIVKLYNTDHTTLLAEPEAIEDLLPKLACQFEEPFADSSAVVTYMVCKMARKYVTVVLTGDGGDENFAGYDGRLKRLDRDIAFDTFALLVRPLGIPATALLFKTVHNQFFERTNRFLEKSKKDLADRYVSYNSFFSNKEKELLYLNKLKEIVFGIDSNKIARVKFKEAMALDTHDRALSYDMTSWLPDSQLTKIDIASMSVSLEARSPFLDRKMLELACKIPFNLKVHGNNGYKYILKKAVEKIVPKENLYRQKMGFTIPLDRWFTGKIKSYAKSILLSKRSVLGEYLDTKIIKDMLESHSEVNDLGPKIWSLLTLELWFEAYFKDQTF